MFRHRLSLVLVVLAVTIALQGLGAVWVLHQAQQQVERGRIASDIHTGFVELLANKQRLRAWFTQYAVGAGGSLAERDALQRALRDTLNRLYQSAQTATDLPSPPGVGDEYMARLQALRVLDQSMAALERTLQHWPALPADMPAGAAWAHLDRVFEQAEGSGLRSLIAHNIERENAAIQRERAAADRSLALMRTLWIGVSLTLALTALMAMAYFARMLRRPLDALVDGAQAWRRGQLQHRIGLSGRDEFADVARSMNAMAEALEQHQQGQAQQRQQLEALVQERTQALHQANTSLQHTDQRRRQLLADISHELRTPTTAIRGEAEITLRGQGRPVQEYREALQRIVDISRQLGTLIDDLLAMARSDLDALSVVRRPTDLHHPVQSALAQAASLAQMAQITLLGGDCPPGRYVVHGDEQRLCQLLLLLLNNAIAYSHPGTQVQVQIHTLPPPPGWLELRVIDEGIGIASDELEHVFERHFRGEAARRHRAAGSGLGLSIARALAQAHGGELSLHSPADLHSGRGTVAILRLPYLAPPSPDPHTPT